MADLKVNEAQWTALTKKQQDEIFQGLLSTGALKAEDRIVADPQSAEFGEGTVMEPMWNPINDLVKGPCKALCDATAAAAGAWCAANTGGVALAACMAAADAARRECRKRC